jgi:hypothetical protein
MIRTGPCSTEIRLARRNSARAWLERRGLTVQRCDSDIPVPSWIVSAYASPLVEQQLLDLAIAYGFDPDNFEEAPPPPCRAERALPDYRRSTHAVKPWIG